MNKQELKELNREFEDIDELSIACVESIQKGSFMVIDMIVVDINSQNAFLTVYNNVSEKSKYKLSNCWKIEPVGDFFGVMWRIVSNASKRSVQ